MSIAILGSSWIGLGRATIERQDRDQLEEHLNSLVGHSEFKNEVEFREGLEAHLGTNGGSVHQLQGIYEFAVELFLQHLTAARVHLEGDLTAARVKEQLAMATMKGQRYRAVIRGTIAQGSEVLKNRGWEILKQNDVGTSAQFDKVVKAFTAKVHNARSWLQDHFFAIGQLSSCPQMMCEYINDWKLFCGLTRLSPSVKGVSMRFTGHCGF